MIHRLILTLFLLLVIILSNSIYAQDSIRSEVFSLSTCEPNNFALIKKLGENHTKKDILKKLEVRSNKPSAFQITGINPLRYKYYINNEAVTQFLEASPLTLSINNFINGDYLISV